MIRFLKSFIFFLRLLVVKRYVDVILYAPQHFNRGKDGSNEYFKAIIDVLESNNISYISFDEPDYITKSRNNKDSIPFDFIYLVILILRRLYSTEMNCIVKDQKVGSFLSKTFLRKLKFKNYIVLSQSMLSVFRGINNNARLFDLQHGIIYSDKESYIKNNIANLKLSENNVKLLVVGEGFKEILEAADSSNYFKKNIHVIGSKKHKTFSHTHPNRSVLVTLQITEDHTKEQNQKLLDEIINMVNSHDDLVFYIRSHPRFKNDLDVSELFKKTNVAPKDLINCFRDCSIHVTSYSTTTFECAEFGIPTVFLKSLKDNFNMFENEFKYPFDDTLKDVFLNYKRYSDEVINWRERFYSEFDEKKFIFSLK
ncbi:MAG: hypothetical protein CMP60_06050 [Flavobacteriales bacterium]|nr:hypothetical protein [Flavobacteriales bacterium]|tara:strand:+ start:5919 stop:7022 length:1104 start_codon:yes stop_codon:yes gene_type:complete